ncbi:MAG: hypothetical protein IJK31_00370 [Ruminococcus sp.]|nr:hypothetical protein [Ruminococcus sp.]
MNTELAKIETSLKRLVTILISAVIVMSMIVCFTSCDESSSGISVDSESLLENDLGKVSNIKFEKLSYGGVNISGDFEASDYYALSSESYSYDIQFKAYDSDGKTLCSGDIYTPKVSANEKCSFLGNAPVQDADKVSKIKITAIKIFY